MVTISDFLEKFPLAGLESSSPWELTRELAGLLEKMIRELDKVNAGVGISIHETARIEKGVTLKPPVIICANAFIAANSYLRGGVYIGESVTIGPGCEIKTSVICSQSSIAHFNFIGDSIIGSNVNFEAGSIPASYHNDK